MTQSRSNKKGFTLLELLAVMGIMLVLATISVTSYRAMISGSGITASLGHLRQSLALARQQAIMQGKNAYVVFYQDTNTSWYVTCMAEGTKNERFGAPEMLMDVYNMDLGEVQEDSVIYNLSKDNATFSKVNGVTYDSAKEAYQVVTADGIWGGGDRYGWEISKRTQLPRGFKFVGGAPEVIRFKPDGTAADVQGNLLGAGRDIVIHEEIRPNKYAVKVKSNGSTEVIYNYNN